MHRGFGGTAFEPAEERRDRELTLGPATMIGLALALCAVCAVCFLWGYSIGHRGVVEGGIAAAPASGPSAAQLLSGQPKPVASQSGSQTPPGAQPAAGSEESTASASSNSAAPVAASYPAAPASGSGAPPAGSASVVQAALPAQSTSSQASAAAGQVQPALGQNTAWMVQIAAVSHEEDADVLVSALRKHGYVVSARRDLGDNLLHVQVGPFTTHADAASMRQRLLNDGYNAIIEP